MYLPITPNIKNYFK